MDTKNLFLDHFRLFAAANCVVFVENSTPPFAKTDKYYFFSPFEADDEGTNIWPRSLCFNLRRIDSPMISKFFAIFSSKWPNSPEEDGWQLGPVVGFMRPLWPVSAMLETPRLKGGKSIGGACCSTYISDKGRFCVRCFEHNRLLFFFIFLVFFSTTF